MGDTYEEYLVTDGNGKICGYYKNNDEAIECAKKEIQSVIYGAHWVQCGKVTECLHRVWKKLA